MLDYYVVGRGLEILVKPAKPVHCVLPDALHVNHKETSVSLLHFPLCKRGTALPIQGMLDPDWASCISQPVGVSALTG